MAPFHQEKLKILSQKYIMVFFQNFNGKFFEKKFLVILHGRKTNYTFVRYYMKCLYAILEVPKNLHGLEKSVFSMFWFLNSLHTHYNAYYSAENSHFKGKRRKSHQDIIRWSWNNKQMVLMVQKIIFRVRQDSQMTQNGHFRPFDSYKATKVAK